MAVGLAFSVTDWMAWTPGRESRAAWRHWAQQGPAADSAEAAASAPPVEAGSPISDLVDLPANLRRRADP